MDKDAIILKNQQLEVDDIKKSSNTYFDAVERNKNDIVSLNNQVEELFSQLGLNYEKNSTKSRIVTPVSLYGKPSEDNYDYEELFQKSKRSLELKGIDVYNLSYADLLDEDVIRSIEIDLNRALPRREKWNSNDKIIVFVAALVGSIADLIFGNRNNSITGSGEIAEITDKGWKFTRGNNSGFSDWLNSNFHNHPDMAPIDYQGKGFGGPHHRQLSKGHDLLRFIEAILQIKNGRFEGIIFQDNTAIKVASSINQYGNSYEQMKTSEAILTYLKHMKGDFFSTTSLPIPGYSFLRESSNRELRLLSANMYRAGFNLKNIVIQSCSTIAIELILRIYMAITETKRIINQNKSINILEDYSNINNLKGIIMPASNPKYREMFLIAHAIVTSFNIGKVIIKKAPWEINITEILMTIRYLVPYIKDVLYRYSDVAKLNRNTEEITSEWSRLLEEIDHKGIILPMPKNELILI